MTTTRLIDQLPRAEAPCPPWCAKPEGHPYESETHEGAEVRPHTRTLFESPTVQLYVEAEGVADHNGAPETLAPVLACCRIETRGSGEVYVDDLTASDARELAERLPAALLAAAEWLEAQS
jgi:hypothetical protein